MVPYVTKNVANVSLAPSVTKSLPCVRRAVETVSMVNYVIKNVTRPVAHVKDILHRHHLPPNAWSARTTAGE